MNETTGKWETDTESNARQYPLANLLGFAEAYNSGQLTFIRGTWANRTVQRPLEIFGDGNIRNDKFATQAAIGYLTGELEPTPCTDCIKAADGSSQKTPVFPECVSLQIDPRDDSEDN